MNCQYCDKENEGGWFYCRSCGKRAHPPKFTTNSWMRSEIASQTKMEFSVKSMDDSIKSMEGDAMSSKLRSMGIKPL